VQDVVVFNNDVRVVYVYVYGRISSTHTSRIYNNMIIFSDCHLFSVRSSSSSSSTCYCYYRTCACIHSYIRSCT